MPRTLLAAITVLACVATARADKPVDGNTARPGFKPPVLIGVQNDGKGPKLRPIPFPAADEPWFRAQTAHFVIYSSASEVRSRQMAEGLETLAAALTRFAPSIASTAGTPTRVLVFTRGREVQPYFDYLLNRDAAHVTGVFVLQKNAGSMIIEAGSVTQGERTPFHELVHSLLERSDKRAPLWLEEGLAEYFSTAELRSGSKLGAKELHSGTLFVGAPVIEHIDTIRRSPVMPMERLFGVVRESDTYNLPAGQRMFYAESWAAVDALMRRDREHFSDFYTDEEERHAARRRPADALRPDRRRPRSRRSGLPRPLSRLLRRRHARAQRRPLRRPVPRRARRPPLRAGSVPAGAESGEP
jgi:hypothetical protein